MYVDVAIIQNKNESFVLETVKRKTSLHYYGHNVWKTLN